MQRLFEVKTKLRDCTPLYRYMPFERFRDIIEHDQLGMLRTCKWNDPFEGFLFRRYVDHWVACPHKDLISCLYCVCFTTDKEKDLIWRSYTPRCNGVRIHTTVSQLATIFDDGFVLGEVRYRNRKQMKVVHDDALRDGNRPIEQLRNLFLYKLLGFKHDHEVRLLTLDASLRSDVKNVPLEACSLFSQVMCDPRMDSSAFDQCKDEIESIYDKKGKSVNVTKSTLYDPARHLRLQV